MILAREGSHRFNNVLIPLYTTMESCDTFLYDKHIQYVLDVGNEKDTLAAVPIDSGVGILGCYGASAYERSILGIVHVGNPESGRSDEQGGTRFVGREMPECRRWIWRKPGSRFHSSVVSVVLSHG